MNARSKIYIDRIIGKPLAFLLNGIVWPLGKIIRRSHDDSPSAVKVIALAKFLGMGSIVRATPLVRALRKKYPAATYLFITTNKNKTLVERTALFDECLCIRDRDAFTTLIDMVRLLVGLLKRKVDFYFDLEVYSALSTVLALLSGARNRYGFYRESTRFRRGLNTHLVYFNDQQHISRIYLHLARACGITDFDYTIQQPRIDAGDRQELKQWFDSQGIVVNHYVVINPNASDLLLERRWPREYFIALINTLVKSWKFPIILVGNQKEQPYVQRLWQGLCPEAQSLAFNSAGVISLGAVLALIAGSSLVITNDSGLYHIAASLRVRVLSLWGPVNPSHYADPADENNAVFYCQEVYCSPCVHRTDFPPCLGSNVCMKSIDPEMVYQVSCRMLAVEPQRDLAFLRQVFAQSNRGNLDITIRTP